MSGARIVSGVFLAVTAVVTACSDGGPPGASNHTGSHRAPETSTATAADGGEPESQPAAADSDGAPRATAARENAADADAGDEPDGPMFEPSSPIARVTSRGLAALCDGSPGITFAAIAFPGGQEDPARKVMTENGFNFLIIEGTCRYWAMPRLLAHVTSGMLSDAEQQDVVDAFHLDQWTLNTGSIAGPSAADGPSYYMLFGRELNALNCTSGAAAPGCDEVKAPGKFAEFDTLLSSYTSKLEQLANLGKAFTGDVRYVLIADAGSWLNWEKPSSWPLGDPDSVALSKEAASNYKPGQSQVARGADALALQEIWRKFLDGEISGHQPYNELAIPVEVGGKRYALYLRDSIPLENDRGLILF